MFIFKTMTYCCVLNFSDPNFCKMTLNFQNKAVLIRNDITNLIRYVLLLSLSFLIIGFSYNCMKIVLFLIRSVFRGKEYMFL